MSEVVVRLQEIELNSFKNIEKGKITFKGYNTLKKDNNFIVEGSDILGIYGQNGSGKTALIDALGILKNVMSGEELNKNTVSFIESNKGNSLLKFVFLVEKDNIRNLAYYDLELRRDEKGTLAEISKEILSYRPLDGEVNKTKLIEYDLDSNAIFRPFKKYKELISYNKEDEINLGVARALAIKSRKSFIFNDESINIFIRGFKESLEYKNIIESLRNFAESSLYVINNEQIGLINMNQVIPFNFRMKDEEGFISGAVVALFKKSLIPQEIYIILKNIISQINIVINSIIPGLNIDIIDYGKELDENGDMKINVELVSIRDSKKIPLRYESEGIKKIISILSAVIGVYNNKSICLAVDELDAGIFEYLLGEILSVLEKNAKGQFIFTSHNLRILEKLNKDSIIFTTTNPKNRYIRLSNVKSNNNLRDFYLREIALGGQKETMYESTNTFEINYAFKKAGKVLYEK